MVLKYTWLKILDVLKRRGAKVLVRDLWSELDSRGFRMPPRELTDDLQKMFEAGLVESDILVSADGMAVVAIDDSSSVGISAAGLRKLTMIIKI